MFVLAQEVAGLTYAPGQRWTHNCMECECLVSSNQLNVHHLEAIFDLKLGLSINIAIGFSSV